MKSGNRPAHLILASASPRRAELLREQGYDFEIIASPLAEPADLPAHMSPAAQAEFLSRFKAKAVADLVSANPAFAATPIAADGKAFILGADTIAAIGNRVFGKPADRDDARRILDTLTGVPHQVITGVTLLRLGSPAGITRHGVTLVHMRRLSASEMEAYLDTGAWAGKAGAYGIQDHGDAFVERIEGSFSNVVGLPMELLQAMMQELGV